MPGSEWRGARRVLAIRLDNVGDVVMLSPALRALRSALPEASITLMASPGGAQVAPMLPWIDDVWAIQAVWQDASAKMPLDPAREQQLIAAMRAREFDAAFIFTSFSQSPHPPAYACYLAGVPFRAGESKEFAGSVLTHEATPLDDETYQAERNLHLLESVGIDVASRRLELAIPEATHEQVDTMLRAGGIDAGAAFVAVAPGASCAARRYDAARYAEAIRMLHDATGLPVVLLGSAKEGMLTASVREAPGVGAIDLAGETNVPELAAVIARASVLIANNSGPLHIAEAVGCPVVTLYSGTDYERQWAPQHAPSTVLRRPTHCTPCYGFECTYSMECLDIPAEEVAAAAMRLLGGASAARELKGMRI